MYAKLEILGISEVTPYYGQLIYYVFIQSRGIPECDDEFDFIVKADGIHREMDNL